MQLTITESALDWYKREMSLSAGSHIRFFARYGENMNSIQAGFSLGMALEEPKEPTVQVVNNGITFFIEKEDEWYFDNQDLTIIYNDAYDEIEFQYN